ncbi:MAG TPA: tRNA (N(6)-L-threonylcarbamoyladenosine(37)-C(2))-methylthiotransferase MtaB [Candidatus Avanaerovorax faecigallinarum]|nr:tRNA (N(6)-L-threonylcarbamoyladenosine(37)-C(2))-methylthiotransferase MtaB [Candidatus Avanaerovorax faecigallinarum]
MKIAFYTLGCKVNQYETEALKEEFARAGYQVTGEDDVADIYVINTCTVTNLADRKSRQYIRRMKRRSPEAVIAVTGCYAQTKPEEVASVEGVDIVAGNGEKNELKRYIEDFIDRREAQEKKDRDKLCMVTPCEELTEYRSSGIITSMESRTRAYIKIEEGCNRFCSYCMIPYARGPVRSRNPEEIIREAKTLIDKGFKELILTGINTALYGAERDGLNGCEPYVNGAAKSAQCSGIEPLIRDLSDIPGDFRIRLSSLEPTVINAEYVRGLLKYEKLCHHLHLSIQSGSDEVLGKMNRHYTVKEYMDIVNVLKDFDPLYGITTDIIAGFPGETEAAFGETLAAVDAAGFCRVHCFRYSKRSGTKAAEMTDQIPGNVKNERLERLAEKAGEAASAFYEKCRGNTRQVLFEERTEEGLLTGYTDNYVRVYAGGGDELLGAFADVRLLHEYRDGMKGETTHE